MGGCKIWSGFIRSWTSLRETSGGARTLADCSGRLKWPRRGVYFFREPGEERSDSGEGPRIVRVGTHDLKTGAGTKLWGRLSQHRGQLRTGGGNHRGSIFRLLVGVAVACRNGTDYPTWGDKKAARSEVKKYEHALECEVSRVIGGFPFLWVSIDDDAGPDSMRGWIERNSIALLSNFDKPLLDPPSQNWLGRCCDREKVKSAGLWNSDHVDELYDPAFLDELEGLVARCQGGRVKIFLCAVRGGSNSMRVPTIRQAGETAFSL